MSGLVSIIIPIYGVEKQLNKCVNSVVNQTYKNLEIILVDDGSPDNCPKMCDDWAKKDSRIKVIHKENGGLSDARNAGLKVAKGKYVTFLDSDDYVDLTMYEKMVNKIVEDGSDMVMCGIVHEFENGEQLPLNETNLEKCNAENILYYYTLSGKSVVNNEIVTPNVMGSVCRVLYSKTFINKQLFVKDMFCEDLVFNVSLIDKNTKISVVTDRMYYYLQRTGSILHTFNIQKYNKRMIFTKRIIELLESKLDAESLNAYKFQLYLVFLKEIALSKNKDILKIFKKDDMFRVLNNSQNYKAKQKETKLFKYKVANFLAYKKMFWLYFCLVRVLVK